MLTFPRFLPWDILGISHHADESEIQRVFKEKAMKIHPDISSKPIEEAEAEFKLLLEAKEAALEVLMHTLCAFVC